MKLRTILLVGLVGVLLLWTSSATPQSVADVARAQREKREQKKANSGKVYTDEDLKRQPASAGPNLTSPLPTSAKPPAGRTQSQSSQANPYAGMSKRELERRAADIEVQLAEEEGGAVGAMLREYLPGEMEKVRKAAQDQGFDIQVQSRGSLEEKRKRRLSLMSDQGRKEEIRSLEEGIAQLEELLRDHCGSGKPAGMSRECEDAKRMLDDRRAELGLVRSIAR